MAAIGRNSNGYFIATDRSLVTGLTLNQIPADLLASAEEVAKIKAEDKNDNFIYDTYADLKNLDLNVQNPTVLLVNPTLVRQINFEDMYRSLEQNVKEALWKNTDNTSEVLMSRIAIESGRPDILDVV